MAHRRRRSALRPPFLLRYCFGFRSFAGSIKGRPIPRKKLGFAALACLFLCIALISCGYDLRMGELAPTRMLFDGRCPLCRREATWLRRRDKHSRILFEDFTDPAFDFDSLGVSIDQLNATMHGVLPDGTVVRGMDALRAFYRAVGYGWLTAPTGWPIVRYLFDGFYWIWAKLRVKHGTCADTTCS